MGRAHTSEYYKRIENREQRQRRERRASKRES
jgi:hypothetical protein